MSDTIRTSVSLTAETETNTRETRDRPERKLGKTTQLNLLTMKVDVVFKLDIKRIPTPDGSTIGHNFLLSVSNATQKVKESELSIRHLVDLGVLTFYAQVPNVDQDMVCRKEGAGALWTSRNGLIDIWAALGREVSYHQRIMLTPPLVPAPRRLQFGLTGLKYFRLFDHPEISRVPSTFICNYSYGAGESKTMLTELPALFQ